MTLLSNRVITIYNRKTSVRLAQTEWEALDNICEKERVPRKTLIELIDLNRNEKLGLTSAIRLFIIVYYTNALINPSVPKNDEDDFINPVFEAIKGIV